MPVISLAGVKGGVGKAPTLLAPAPDFPLNELRFIILTADLKWRAGHNGAGITEPLMTFPFHQLMVTTRPTYSNE
jgi:hypothetical protein